MPVVRLVRTMTKTAVNIELSLITELSNKEQRAVAATADRFGKFLGLRANII